MDLSERRRWWVAYLAEQRGRDALAQELGYQDTNYLNQVISGHATLGNGNAKKWQERLALRPDWFDRLVPGEDSDGPSNDELAELQEMLAELGPEKFAEELASITNPSAKESAQIAQYFLSRAVSDL